jgi:hypothetical protein
VFFVFGRGAWHSFGRIPCARHRRSFCFQWHYHNNFALITRVLAKALVVEIAPVPGRKHSLGLGACATRFLGAQANGQKTKEHSMNFNQLTIIGYIGKNAETKQLTNGTPVTKFSVATTRS